MDRQICPESHFGIRRLAKKEQVHAGSDNQGYIRISTPGQNLGYTDIFSPGLQEFLAKKDMSRLVGKPTMWFPNRSDTNRPVQAQKRASSLKFRI